MQCGEVHILVGVEYCVPSRMDVAVRLRVEEDGAASYAKKTEILGSSCFRK